MANIIENKVNLYSDSGQNIYFIIMTSDAQYYNGYEFEPYDSLHWNNYAIEMEYISLNTYQGIFPSVESGYYYIYSYSYVSYKSVDDKLVGFGTMNWNGFSESNCLDGDVIELGTGVNKEIYSINHGVNEINGDYTILLGIDNLNISEITNGIQKITDDNYTIQIGIDTIDNEDIITGVQ